jgi:hypothetical protein
MLPHGFPTVASQFYRWSQVIRYDQRRNEQAAKSHKKQRHGCII